MNLTSVALTVHASTVATVPLFLAVLFAPVHLALQERDASYLSILVMVSCVKMVAPAWLKTR